MAVKKSELYSSIWKSCDELRGGMDASQYKDYVLVLLFMKYVSDKAASRRDYLLDVPSGASFEDMVAAKNQKDVGDRINKIIAKLSDANPSLRGAIDVANFNDPDKLGKGQEMVDRLTRLIGIFQNPALDFRSNTAEGDDLLGDAYEYLMRNFATESGKSKGQFYTPAEVSRVMAAIVGVTKATSNTQAIYDPTCGSGSLLLKAHSAAKAATGFDLAIYGQEMDNATAALARMNMVLHDAETAEIWQDNTLARPHWTEAPHQLKQFDFVVANPPFSQKAWMTGFSPERDDFGRFAYGLPPAKNGDYAFLLHMLSSLKSTGRAAVILPHGVLFRQPESLIRSELVRRGYIEAVIGLPPNLFYGTSIPACIIILDKAGAAGRSDIFMIDASRGFMKDGNKNRLRERDIHRIITTFAERSEEGGFSRLVAPAEVRSSAFNLNLARYIENPEPEDREDLTGHLIGRIPLRDVETLGSYWDVFSGLRENLIGPDGREGYCSLLVEPAQIDAVIEDHPDVRELGRVVRERIRAWSDGVAPQLAQFSKGGKPKPEGEQLSGSILRAFQGVPLLDPYSVYQRFMDYWAATLQDDLYLIAAAGWEEAARPHLVVEVKGQKVKEIPDFVVAKQKYKSDLIPAEVLVAWRFAEMRDELLTLAADVARSEQALEELAEAHIGEGGALEEMTDDAGKIVASLVNNALKADPSGEDAGVLRAFVKTHGSLGKAKQRLRVARDAMNVALGAAYSSLTSDEIKELVVVRKWLTHLCEEADDETDELRSTLGRRLRELAGRYAHSLPALVTDSDRAAEVVDAHLREMGLKW